EMAPLRYYRARVRVAKLEKIVAISDSHASGYSLEWGNSQGLSRVSCLPAFRRVRDGLRSMPHSRPRCPFATRPRARVLEVRARCSPCRPILFQRLSTQGVLR